MIDAEHLLQAIQNSIEHSHQTAHRVTGLYFKYYEIIVHKRKGMGWYVECRLKAVEREAPGPKQREPRRLRCPK
jgi:hypothetical protein